MADKTCFFDDENPKTLDPLHFGGKRLLIAGVGGGADCVTAWAMGQWLKSSATPPASIIIANAKKSTYVEKLAPRREGRHIFDPDKSDANFYLDTRLPHGEPCVIIQSPNEGDAALIDGVENLDFNAVLAVDTGADIVTRTGRDWYTYQALVATGRPIVLALVAPGSDGQEQPSRLRQGAREMTGDHTLLGNQPTSVLRPAIEEMASTLEAYCRARKNRGEKSTLQIAASAFDRPPTDEIKVPRDEKPLIPARWLQGVWFLTPRQR